MKLTGPFSQILNMDNLPLKGPLSDDQLEIIPGGGVVTSKGHIVKVGDFDLLSSRYPSAAIERIHQPMVLLPGFIDSHTHACFGGSRSLDYALRNSGRSYLEIARAGGGIWSSVQMTRAAEPGQLLDSLLRRIERHLSEGVTTMEIKSGYGLELNAELKMLRCIRDAAKATKATLVATCLAAHIIPKDFEGDESSYLDWILDVLLPAIRKEQLANRVDIFVEQTAFSNDAARRFLEKAGAAGFQCTVHADQFTAGSSVIAAACEAVSADHLEASGEKEIAVLAASDTVATVLPGASIGLGMAFAPARRLLDAGCCLAIASDWNPGSAPQGDLLLQAAILGAYEKLTAAEIFAGLTYRAARALRLEHAGSIKSGMRADLQAYPCASYLDILYNQGKLKPSIVWIAGNEVKTKLGLY